MSRNPVSAPKNAPSRAGETFARKWHWQANDLPVVAQALSTANRVISSLLTVAARIRSLVVSTGPSEPRPSGRGCFLRRAAVGSSRRVERRHFVVLSQLRRESCNGGYATKRSAFRFHKKTRLVSSSAPLAISRADLSTDFATRPSCREVRFAWSRTTARRCLPLAGSRKNIKPPPKLIPAMRPRPSLPLPCIECSPF